MGLNSPGVPSNQLPPDEAWLVRKVADLERVVRELAPSIAKSFAPVIARLDATDADLIAKQAAIDAQQATLTTTVEGLSAAVADIATNLASINTLITQVVTPGIVNHTDTGFAVTLDPSWATGASTTITVPAGCTQLLATCTAAAYAINPNTTGGDNTAGGDLLRCRVALNGAISERYSQNILGSASSAVSSSSGSFQFSGLTPGSTLTISAQACAAFQALGSNVVNKATINATLVWLR